MGDNERAKLIVDGDISPLRQKLREAGDDLKRFGAEGEGVFQRMTGPLGSLQSKFVAIAGILAGGKVFGAAVDESKRLTDEANRLGRTLGISAGEASILNVALGDVFSSSENLTDAAAHLGRQVRSNESDLNALGLRTREANGEYRNMRDIMMDALTVLRSYKEGTDRNLAAQAMFARGAGESAKLLKLNSEVMEEARQKAEALGLTIGVQNVEATKQYKAAMNDAGDVMSAIKKTIGDAVMPVLTQLAVWFASVGPAAVIVFRGVIGGLVSTFWILKAALVQTSELIKALGISLAAPIIGAVEAIGMALDGNFSGAAARLKESAMVSEIAWRTAFRNIEAEGVAAGQKIWNIFATPDAVPAAAGKGRSYKAPAKDEKEKEPSFMATYEAVLAERKNAYEQENALREFSKEQELAYWRELQSIYTLSSKDQVAIVKRTAQLELEIRRKHAKDVRDVEAVAIEARRNAALAQVESDAQAAQFARESNQLTKVQLLEQEEQFARRRFEIEYQALLERMELLKKDPTTTPAALAQIKEQMLEIERNYQLRRSQIGFDKEKAGGLGNVFDDTGTAFGRMASNMLTTATTLRQQLAGVFQSIYQSFVTNLISNPLGQWLAAQARMLAVKMGFLSQEKAAEAAASATTVAIKSAETTAVVGANAVEAATGAAASQAPIPIVGPALALAAMAAMFAAVTAMGSRKSAARGYDIPRGLNPVVQTHEEEMILPSPLANGIRRIIAGQEEGGAGSREVHHHNWNIQAWDSRDVSRLLLDNKRHVAAAAESAVRDGWRGKR